ncbi:ABC transporter ATP-binding protein [Humidisolicoccus flavus]|uniref:ABC transporter ATP-binding protein n=1 Tax=Humidisolicoccus flavus TaxID=3111414 RepID=UPI00324E5DD0
MLLKLLGRYLRPYLISLIAVVVFQFAQSVAALTLPTINATIIDDGVAKGDTDLIWQLGRLMLLVSLAQIAASICAIYFGARAAMRAGAQLRADVFKKVASFSEREVAQFGAASLITRNTNDVQQVQMLVLMTCTMLVMAPMMAIGGVFMALRADGQLSWLIAVAVPLMVLVLALIVTRLIPIFVKLQDRLDNINRVMREQLTGIRVVRAFVQERREVTRFTKANDKLTDAMLRTGNLFVLMFPLIMFIVQVSSTAVLWFGASLVDEGSLEIGTLMAFLQYLMQILMGVMIATFMTIMIPRAAVSARRISEVLNTESSVHAPSDPQMLQGSPGLVEFDNAEFTYPGAEHPVLRDINFTVEPGSTTAIIGSTGAGKTTLVGLIPRLFDVTGGAVRVGGVDVRNADPDTLWSSIGIVPQRPFLFSGTIASNLRYGDPEATDEQLWNALEIAQAADFVRSKDGGLESRIAQGGTNVSGGQRQRLAIARALVRKPELLIFDDSFSALDLRTDASLRRALRARVTEATKIIVAQRVSTIVDADQIIVLDDGRVVGSGTHDALLETCSTYQEIVASQATVEAGR